MAIMNGDDGAPDHPIVTPPGSQRFGLQFVRQGD